MSSSRTPATTTAAADDEDVALFENIDEDLAAMKYDDLDSNGSDNSCRFLANPQYYVTTKQARAILEHKRQEQQEENLKRNEKRKRRVARARQRAQKEKDRAVEHERREREVEDAQAERDAAAAAEATAAANEARVQDEADESERRATPTPQGAFLHEMEAHLKARRERDDAVLYNPSTTSDGGGGGGATGITVHEETTQSESSSSSSSGDRHRRRRHHDDSSSMSETASDGDSGASEATTRSSMSSKRSGRRRYGGGGSDGDRRSRGSSHRSSDRRRRKHGNNREMIETFQKMLQTQEDRFMGLFEKVVTGGGVGAETTQTETERVVESKTTETAAPAAASSSHVADTSEEGCRQARYNELALQIDRIQREQRRRLLAAGGSVNAAAAASSKKAGGKKKNKTADEDGEELTDQEQMLKYMRLTRAEEADSCIEDCEDYYRFAMTTVNGLLKTFGMTDADISDQVEEVLQKRRTRKAFQNIYRQVGSSGISNPYLAIGMSTLMMFAGTIGKEKGKSIIQGVRTYVKGSQADKDRTVTLDAHGRESRTAAAAARPAPAQPTPPSPPVQVVSPATQQQAFQLQTMQRAMQQQQATIASLQDQLQRPAATTMPPSSPPPATTAAMTVAKTKSEFEFESDDFWAPKLVAADKAAKTTSSFPAFADAASTDQVEMPPPDAPTPGIKTLTQLQPMFQGLKTMNENQRRREDRQDRMKKAPRPAGMMSPSQMEVAGEQ